MFITRDVKQRNPRQAYLESVFLNSVAEEDKRMYFGNEVQELRSVKVVSVRPPQTTVP